MPTLILRVPISEDRRIRGREGIRKLLRILAGRIHGDITDSELMAMWARALELIDCEDDKVYKIVED